MPTRFDVVISGAGPAGLCAALRLQQLGYQVLLLEAQPHWQRPQASLVLGSGCKCMLEMLEAQAAIAALPRLPGLPTRQIWSKPVAELIAPVDAVVVGRTEFDAALRQLAHRRGIALHAPARISALAGVAGDWQLTLSGPDGNDEVSARWLLDAGGRAQEGRQRLATAPPLAVLWQDWADLPGQLAMALAGAMQLEACEAGWLWGMPLPDMGYRVMWLHEPDAVAANPSRLPQQLAASRLFADLADVAGHGPCHLADCTPYVDGQCWQPGRIRLGEAAFALDPASASGVEKAMRSALQAVIALHTVEFCNDAAHQALAADFYRQHIAETCARHSLWSARHYRQAWCQTAPFWQQRSSVLLPGVASHAGADAGNGVDAGDDSRAELPMQALCTRFGQEVQHLQQYRPPKPYSGPMLRADQILSFAPQASLVSVPCVIDNRVQQHMAIMHPHLERPLVFLENEMLLPRLNLLQQQPTLAILLDVLGQSMSMPKAQRIMGWLWQRGVVEAH